MMMNSANAQASEELLHHVGGELLDAQLHEPALHLAQDRLAALATPLLERMLNGVVPIGALHQVHRLPWPFNEDLSPIT